MACGSWITAYLVCIEGLNNVTYCLVVVYRNVTYCLVAEYRMYLTASSYYIEHRTVVVHGNVTYCTVVVHGNVTYSLEEVHRM